MTKTIQYFQEMFTALNIGVLAAVDLSDSRDLQNLLSFSFGITVSFITVVLSIKPNK